MVSWRLKMTFALKVHVNVACVDRSCWFLSTLACKTFCSFLGWIRVNLGLPTVSSTRTLQARGNGFECPLLTTRFCHLNPKLPPGSAGRWICSSMNSECPSPNPWIWFVMFGICIFCICWQFLAVSTHLHARYGCWTGAVWMWLFEQLGD